MPRRPFILIGLGIRNPGRRWLASLISKAASIAASAAVTARLPPRARRGRLARTSALRVGPLAHGSDRDQSSGNSIVPQFPRVRI
jgi:hypothetical protein